MANFNWLISLFAATLVIVAVSGNDAAGDKTGKAKADEFDINIERKPEEFDVKAGKDEELDASGNGSIDGEIAGRTIVGSKFDPCNPNFCPSTTHCVDRNGRAECVPNAQQQCFPNPCLNGGVCNPSGISYSCTCVGSYTGTHCGQVKSACNAFTCLNGGTCSLLGSSYTCKCLPYYSGIQCEHHRPPTPIPCATNPCLNMGTCNPTGSSYTCTCVSPYFGGHCEKYPSNPCDTNYCLNGGTCNPTGSSYTCTCNAQYSGRNCENHMPCAGNPCLNGGTCSTFGSSYTCACPNQYSGSRCETYTPLPNPCGGHPCFNGGHCSTLGSSPRCACATLNPGARWEILSFPPRNLCASLPCLHGGICSSFGSSYLCACREHYSGSRCEISSLCAPTTCMNGGTCQVIGFSYKCTCIPPYDGLRCEHYRPPSPCDANPCLNGGRCQQSGSSFTCACPPSYYGERCQYRSPPQPSPCDTNPCLNGGRCQQSGSSFTCACPPSYYGEKCQHHLAPNPCAKNPCFNGGTCILSGATYACVCDTAYTGTHCETARVKTQCQLGYNPCKNGCECTPSCRHSSGYFCKSPNGYIGKNCTVPPPRIVCQPNQITVTVDDAFLREYNMGIANTRLHLAHSAKDRATQECFAYTTTGISHTFSIDLPFAGKCGTTVQKVGDQTVVSNNIWLNRYTNAGYDMPVPVICFECLYTKEYMIVTSLRPTVDIPGILHSRGSSDVQGVMELCKVSTSCPNPCPGIFRVTQGNVYTVGQMIHLNIRGDLNSQDRVALKTLHLSCDGNAGSPGVVQLVNNGCPASSNQNYMPSKVTHSGSSAVCASFQVPRLQGCDTFFIHASLEICSATCTYNSINCNFQGRRRRRSTESKTWDSSYGPFYVLVGEDGVPREILFPNRSIVDTPAVILDTPLSPSVEELHSTWIVVGVSILCLLIILSICFAVVYNYRTSLPRKNLPSFSNCVLKFK